MSNSLLSEKPGSIGIFDSGYGGLTILKHIRSVMPEYDFMYLGDNARTPYGTRSFQVVYEFTLQCVTHYADSLGLIIDTSFYKVIIYLKRI